MQKRQIHRNVQEKCQIDVMCQVHSLNVCSHKHKYDVKLLVIENNYNDIPIEKYMNSQGYKKDQRYKVNDFYIK